MCQATKLQVPTGGIQVEYCKAIMFLQSVCPNSAQAQLEGNELEDNADYALYNAGKH